MKNLARVFSSTCCRFGVVVDVGSSSSSSSYDLRQSVQFGSGAVHLVVVKSVLATDTKVARLPTLQ